MWQGELVYSVMQCGLVVTQEGTACHRSHNMERQLPPGALIYLKRERQKEVKVKLRKKGDQSGSNQRYKTIAISMLQGKGKFILKQIHKFEFRGSLPRLASDVLESLLHPV